MNVTVRTPRMTRDQFLEWAAGQEEPHEFDGFEPVAMNGSSIDHSTICHNIYHELRLRLAGRSCVCLGPNVGVATTGNAVRYPDALVTCSPMSGRARLVPAPVVVFEVISPSSGRHDRITKLREYAAVPPVRQYVVLEDRLPALTSFAREAPEQKWIAQSLLADEVLAIPALGIEVPVGHFYAGVDFGGQDEAS